MVPIPGRPNSIQIPTSPRLIRPVTSLVFDSYVPLPGTKVSLCVVLGSLKIARMALGYSATPSDSTKAQIDGLQVIVLDLFKHKIMTFNAHQSEKVAFAVYALFWTLFVVLLTWFLSSG